MRGEYFEKTKKSKAEEGRGKEERREKEGEELKKREF